MKKQHILAELEFGNPKLDCGRFGVCRLSTPDKMILLPMSYGIGLSYLTLESTDCVKIQFIPESLSDLTIKDYFGNGQFWIEEDAAPFVTTDFGSAWQGINFKAGRYNLDPDWTTLVAVSWIQDQKMQKVCNCKRKAA